MQETQETSKRHRQKLNEVRKIQNRTVSYMVVRQMYYWHTKMYANYERPSQIWLCPHPNNYRHDFLQQSPHKLSSNDSERLLHSLQGVIEPCPPKRSTISKQKC